MAHGAALETILQDDAQLLHRPDAQLRRSLEELKLLGVDRIRVTAGWSVLTKDADARTKPAQFDSSDPRAYDQDRFRNLDRLLVLAREYGFKTMIDIAFWAPKWASLDAPAERGRTEIDPEEFARFSTAIARRYSGTFVIPRRTAEARFPLSQSSDERYLRAGFGTTNPEGTSSLHAQLGLSLGGLVGDTDPVIEASLGGAAGDATLPLPKVDVFTLWNEPNHPSFMRPQWVKHGSRFVPRTPHMYRAMVVKAYPAVKAARPDSTVLIGATSFTGAYKNHGTGGVPPLRFLREFACVDEQLRPLKRSGCAGFHGPIPGDGWSHHPYSMQTEPDARNSVGRQDDVPVAELPKLAAALAALVDRGRLAPGNRNIFVTEYGYETNPPDKDEKYTTGDQVRFLTWAEYLASRVPQVKSFAQFLLRDLPPQAFRVGTSKKRAFGEWQSGLLFEDGTPKLAAHSFRAGLFVQRLSGGRLRMYGRLRISPGPRTVVIERRPPGTEAWSAVATVPAGGRAPAPEFVADGHDAFTRFGQAPPADDWRYRVRWRDGDVWRASPSVAVVSR